jgi:curli production assembly/transport component CsgF
MGSIKRGKWADIMGKVFWVAAICAIALPAQASDLVYTPVNPSFGGNPLNSSHLFSMANAQRDATASDAKDSLSGTGGTDGSGGTTGTTDAQLFVQQLQGRLLSALASQVTDAIFGANPQDHGQVIFGDTTVTFDRSIGSINLTIFDATSGTTTQISVPQLQIN